MQTRVSDDEFFKAVNKGDIDTAKIFIKENEHNLNRKLDEWSIMEKAIYYAAYYGLPDMVVFLIKAAHENKSRPSVNWSYSAATPLIYMARHGSIEAVEALIKAGADVNYYTNADVLPAGGGDIRMRCKWTALMWAAYNGNIEIVKLLLDVKNINPIAKNFIGKTAADIAKQRNHLNIANLIHEAMLNSGSANTLFDYGVYFYNKKQHDLAIRAFKKAAELNNNLEKAHYNLGVLYRGQKKIDLAIAAFDKACDLGYTPAIEERRKLKASMTTSNPAEATKPADIPAAKVATPPKTEPAAQEKPTSNPAIQSVTVSAENKKKARDCTNKGMAHYSKNECATALTYFQQAIAFDPASADAYNWAGRACFELKEFSTAEQHLLAACRQDPTSAIYFSNLGAAQFKLQKYAEAEPSLVEAIRLDPNLSAPHNLLGLVYWEQDKFTKAAFQFDRAIQLGHLNSIYWRLLIDQGKEGPALTATGLRELYDKLASSSDKSHQQAAKFYLQRIKLKNAYQQLTLGSQSAQAVPDALLKLETLESDIFMLGNEMLESPMWAHTSSAHELIGLVNLLQKSPGTWLDIHTKKLDCLSLDRKGLYLLESVSINDIRDHLDRQAMKQKYVDSVKNHLMAYQSFIEKYAGTWKTKGWFGRIIDIPEIKAIQAALSNMNGFKANDILSAYVTVIDQLARIENNNSYSPHLRESATQMKQQLDQIRLTKQPDAVKLPETAQLPAGMENALILVSTDDVKLNGRKQPPLIMSSTATMLYATQAASDYDPLTASSATAFSQSSSIPVSSGFSPLEASQLPSAPPLDEPFPYGSANAPTAATQPAYSTQSWQHGTAALLNALPPVPTTPLQYYSLYATPATVVTEPPAGFQWQPATHW